MLNFLMLVKNVTICEQNSGSKMVSFDIVETCRCRSTLWHIGCLILTAGLLLETFSCWKSCRIRKFPLSVIAIAVLDCLKVFLNILLKLQSRSLMNRSVSLMRISISLGSVGCMASSFTTIATIQSAWFLLHTVKAWWKNGFLSLSTINVKFLLLTGRPTLMVFSNVVNCVPIVDKLDSKLVNMQNKSSFLVFASDVRLNY